MLSIFKSKKYLIDLFDGHTDIHNHLIPGIDDGSENATESIALIKAMQSMGITDFICTPHTMGEIYPNTPEDITLGAKNLNTALAKANVDVKVRPSSEYMLDEQFIGRLKGGNMLPLKDNYLLVEISYLQPPINLKELIFEITHAGYIPVLAHPERYSYYHKKNQQYDELQRLGCLFQLNALALGSHYGNNVQQMARKLLEEGRYTFIGTDTHHMRHLEALKNVVYKQKLGHLLEPLLINTKETFSL